MFLCRTVAHRLDVDRALSEITPTEFDEWMALYQLEPWGDDWKQAAMIAAFVHNASATQNSRIEASELIPCIDNLRDEEAGEQAMGANWKQRLGF